MVQSETLPRLPQPGRGHAHDAGHRVHAVTPVHPGDPAEARTGRHRAAKGADGKRDLPEVDPSRMHVTVLVPAHDEEDQIAETMTSLHGQRRRPNRVIVIADNCTDRTADIARAHGAEVIRTVGNRHKKAGALNQVLEVLLPRLGSRHAVLVMDADSALDPGFIHHAVLRLATGELAAVGGTFTGKPGGGLVGMFQRNEYARYARDVRRLSGKALVLTGTATLFRALALKEVVRARRSGRLPGRDQVYDVRVLTEDNELTLALLHLRFRILCPAECTLTTEVMETWKDLFKQRLRWKRGALENLTDYGWTRVTLPYWGRQLLSLVGIVVIFAYLGATAWSIAVTGTLEFHPLWVAVTGVFMVERIVTVRSRGGVQMAVAALLIVEMIFDVFLQITQAKAFWDAAWRRERKW
ncbi:glycosyltransferase family 2 protein [Microbispora sp. NPDC046973]|uniref:glycosyltransferase family 2 protein n=1 Tax=Microbispora sp. NPDC046973 TaxID=3155022 RepID=UPI0033D223C9